MTKITLKTLSGKIDVLTTSIDQLSLAVARGFQAVDDRFNGVDEKYNRLESKVDNMAIDISLLKLGQEDILLRLDNKVDKIDFNKRFKIK